MKKVSLKQLEDDMIRYRDLVNVPVADIGEPVVILDYKIMRNGYLPEMSDMAKVLASKIVLRKTVIQMLIEAEKLLNKKNTNYSLYVTYGYRSLDVQTKRFCMIASNIARKRFFSNPATLYEEIHRFIAVPTVAGHPTGGAVDLEIVDPMGTCIDFGSCIYDFRSKDSYVYSPRITKHALNNRLLLRGCMMATGFAPFDGEWWHFSYGDREWAYYYQKKNAIYQQLSIREAKQSLTDGL